MSALYVSVVSCYAIYYIYLYPYTVSPQGQAQSTYVITYRHYSHITYNCLLIKHAFFFRLFLTVSQIDYLVVHCFIFVFDLTIVMWMMWHRSRDIAMIFCALFHFMNSRLFRIGLYFIFLNYLPYFKKRKNKKKYYSRPDK